MIDDPVDELILAEASPYLTGSRPGGADGRSVVAVLDAPDLTAAVRARVDPTTIVRASCDDLRAETRLRQVGGDAVEVMVNPADAVVGACVVLLRLPTALAALDETAGLIARLAAADVRMVAGGRVKHMTRSMNEVLARHFDNVRPSLGHRKARALHAWGPLPSAPYAPRVTTLSLPGPNGSRDVTLWSHGATFASGRVDAGTRLLLTTRDRWPAATDIVDLGCGSGVLAIAAALAQPRARVLAIDSSTAACASATATFATNDVAVTTLRANGLTLQATESADLIVCNPPFHRGAAKDSTPAMVMLADAGRVLRTAGELWTVYNAHLPYLPLLRDRVGPTTVAVRDRHYVVTRSVRD